MKNKTFEKLHHKRFINSSNSSIKKFGYTYFHQEISLVLKQFSASKKNITNPEFNILCFMDYFDKILPYNLAKQLPIHDLVRSNKMRILALKKLTSKKYLSKKFLHYIQEEEQLSDMKYRRVGGLNKPFLTDKAASRVLEQDKSNKHFLTKFLHEDQCIDSFLENQEKSKNYALYQQVSTIEDIATERNYDLLFINITATPEHHSNTRNGNMFHSWNGESVRDIHDKFNYQFKLHRNYLYRHGMSFSLERAVNIKTVEPTDSGCPHYHIALFCNSSLSRFYMQSYIKYFTNKFSNVKIELITAKKLRRKKKHYLSFVTNYITKHCHFLETNRDAEKTKRIIMWRKYNRIRSFQFSGLKGEYLNYKKLIKHHNKPSIKNNSNIVDIPTGIINICFKKYLQFSSEYKSDNFTYNNQNEIIQT